MTDGFQVTDENLMGRSNLPRRLLAKAVKDQPTTYFSPPSTTSHKELVISLTNFVLSYVEEHDGQTKNVRI
ncbi:hypothetical protein V8B55DRAFT_1570974 [Mucor lusitanicus]|uniref:Uncharacterized protein n=1 Tax=Mucor lusitanicus CBS 277.49 TaxID=747725 RepID=A0A162YVD9_MUCCL|nr:hypothetical protein MUCCIDRAFT_112296 [Mucor lusitanicus CBS 277.49]